MRVMGAGFGRTGTLSLKRALEELGFGPTYHMEETIRRPSHIRRWLRYARTGEVDWDARFREFGSGVDFPVSCAWEALASHYPDAKVVLTVRDPQRWWASTESTIYRFRTVFPGWLLRVVPTIRDWLEMTDRLVWDGLLDVPMPLQPFPHLNDTKVMQRRLAGLWWGTRGAPIVVAAAAAIVPAVRTRKRRSARSRAAARH